MKGVKCTKSLKLSTILVALFALFFTILNVNNTYATNLGTTEFTLRYFTNNGSYDTVDQIYFGRQYGKSIVYGAANIYSFYTSQITASGSYAVIHFETNMVISTDDISTIFGYWSNLNEIDILNVYVNGTSYSSYIESTSVNHVVTDWSTTINGVPYYNSTLTVYGDVVVSNVPASNNVIFQVVVGSLNYAFYTNNTDNPDLFYFEQNPMTIDFTTDINDALLQTQINQNNTIINQNQYLIDQNNQDRSDLQNTSDNAQDGADAAASNINNAKTSLLTVIGNFINVVIHPPASNCVIDADMGNMDLGDIDLCQLSLPPAFAVIGTLLIIGFIIPFAYSLIMTVLSLLKGATDN